MEKDRSEDILQQVQDERGKSRSINFYSRLKKYIKKSKKLKTQQNLKLYNILYLLARFL